jgi:hypothetical protein
MVDDADAADARTRRQLCSTLFLCRAPPRSPFFLFAHGLHAACTLYGRQAALLTTLAPVIVTVNATVTVTARQSGTVRLAHRAAT